MERFGSNYTFCATSPRSVDLCICFSHPLVNEAMSGFWCSVALCQDCSAGQRSEFLPKLLGVFLKGKAPQLAANNAVAAGCCSHASYPSQDHELPLQLQVGFQAETKLSEACKLAGLG